MLIVRRVGFGHSRGFLFRLLDSQKSYSLDPHSHRGLRPASPRDLTISKNFFGGYPIACAIPIDSKTIAKAIAFFQ